MPAPTLENQQRLLSDIRDGRIEAALQPERIPDLLKMPMVACFDKDELGLAALANKGEIYRGPDGLDYVTLYLPSQEREAVSFVSLEDLISLDIFAERVLGIAIRTDANRPGKILPFAPGLIWALRQFGEFEPKSDVNRKLTYFDEHVPAEHRPLFLKALAHNIARPSNELVPDSLRADLSKVLTRTLGIGQPKFCVAWDREEGVAGASLVYNCFYASGREFNRINDVLSQIHPPHIRFTILSLFYKGIERHMHAVCEPHVPR